MNRAYLALGSNLGDRLSYLQGAVDGLVRTLGVHVIALSRVYETEPVGGPEQGAYLNAVVAIDTELGPRELLALAQQLEAEAHRVRQERWGPRTLDVDLLLFDDVHLDDPELTLPHPRMWDRAFVLVPLNEVAPELFDEAPADDGVHVAPVTLQLPTP